MNSQQQRPHHRRTQILVGQLVPTRLAATTATTDAPAAAVGSNLAGEAAVSRLRIDPLTPSLGVEVFGFDFDALCKGDQPLFRQIDELFMRYKVVMFRDTKLDQEGHVQFISTLAKHWGINMPQSDQARQVLGPNGLLVDPMFPQMKDAPEVLPIDCFFVGSGLGRIEQGVIEVKNLGPYRAFPADKEHMKVSQKGRGNVQGAANMWHSDCMFLSEPAWVTTTRAVSLPPIGGDVMFANMEQAYEDLDDATKQSLQGIVSVNRNLTSSFEAAARKTGAKEDREYVDWLVKTFPETRFPVVRKHEFTGKKALYMNGLYTRTLEAAEGGKLSDGGKALLKRLTDLAQVPEYQCRMRWRNVGDLLMWDNRSVQHYAIGDYGEVGGYRWLDHVATLGTKPIEG